MFSIPVAIGLAIAGLLVGTAIGYLIRQRFHTREVESKAHQQIDEAERDAAQIKRQAEVEAKEQVAKATADAEKEAARRARSCSRCFVTLPAGIGFEWWGPTAWESRYRGWD